MTDSDPSLTNREIDAMVWQALAGQKPDSKKCRWIDGDVQPHAGYPTGHISPPHYHLDLNAIWKAVDYMREKHGFAGHNGFMLVGQETGDDPVPDHLWYCEFPEPWVEASADTVQLAICKAFLKVFGVGTDDF